ncbi:MAG: sulfite exporter TauE/SafE family protein [Comamonadaceae bacterium]|nr:MAG: sulfite exporter TauE/SafE family protein [Comamonadaceae bacterium]
MDFQTLVIITGAVVAGFVQGLSGFAFGMVALSFWAWAVDPKLAAAMAVCGALTGQVVAAVTVRRGFDWRVLAPFLAGGLAGIPLGLFLLPRMDVNLFKAFLGALMVVWCPAMIFSNRLPRITAGGSGANAAVGAMGGVMSAIGGFAGVIPTLWCTLRGYERDKQRAIIQNFNLSILAVTFITYLATGLISRETLPMLALVIPAMLVPSLLGARLYIGISDLAFRRIVLGLLTASGVALLMSSVPTLLASQMRG